MADTSFMDDVVFPIYISWGSAGGPDWPADIAESASGWEERNTSVSNPLRRYDAKYGVRSHDELYEILELYLAAMGRLRGFRLKDWLDYRSGSPLSTVTATDQAIGTGDGVTAAFQLKKTYTFGAASFARTIVKTVSGTVRVAVAGVEKTLATHFTVNHATGVVTFTGGNIPTAGQAITAGFEFHVPVRFDCALDQAQIRGPLGDLPSIWLKELRL